MRWLKPIEEAQASSKVRDIYQEVKRQLHSPFTPLLFQLVANYEDYLEYLWQQVKANLQSSSFLTLPPKVAHYAEHVTTEWVDLHPTLREFVARLAPSEKEELKKTADDLTAINATLTLLTIAERESLKGIPVGVLKLVSKASTQANTFAEIKVEQFAHYSLLAGEQPSTQLSPAAALLAPLTGNQQLAISRYAQFFEIVGHFMDKLLKTETYLKHRVILEELVQNLVPQIPQPLTIKQQQFMDLTENSPQAKHVHELFFLLYDLFPSKFPHMVFTSAIMKQALQ